MVACALPSMPYMRMSSSLYFSVLEYFTHGESALSIAQNQMIGTPPTRGGDRMAAVQLRVVVFSTDEHIRLRLSLFRASFAARRRLGVL